MQSNYNNLSDTIFAPITSRFSGAVCVFRISGNDATLLETFLSTKNLKSNFSTFARVFDESGEILDEAVVVYFKSPKSFTGQDCIEISLHQSQYIFDKFCDILTKNLGFRVAFRGEFLYRAFVNQKVSLSKAESIDILIKSQTKSQHTLAIRGIDNIISRQYQIWYDEMVKLYSLIEANIDFSDQEIPAETIAYIANSLKNLQNKMEESVKNDAFSKIIDGVNIAILGKVNAGKSSLINAICNKKVSIVSEKAGTTRDIVSFKIDVGGYLVNILDTAGIRFDSEDEIEKEGVEMALDAAKSADIRIFVCEKGEFDSKIKQDLHQEGDILVCSKFDICEDFSDESFIKISTKNAFGLDVLMLQIKEKIEKKLNIMDENFAISDRHKAILKKACEVISLIDIEDSIEILAEDFRILLNTMGEIFGYKSNDDILGNIFSKFCIGK